MPEQSPRVLRITSCIFQRSEHSPLERGIMLNEGKGALIDMMGKPVPPQGGLWWWDYDRELEITYRPSEAVDKRGKKGK